jgi:hypothetical protein
MGFFFAITPIDDWRLMWWQTRRLGHRAIGVVYDSGAEYFGNYVPTVLGRGDGGGHGHPHPGLRLVLQEGRTPAPAIVAVAEASHS